MGPGICLELLKERELVDETSPLFSSFFSSQTSLPLMPSWLCFTTGCSLAQTRIAL